MVQLKSKLTPGSETILGKNCWIRKLSHHLSLAYLKFSIFFWISRKTTTSIINNKSPMSRQIPKWLNRMLFFSGETQCKVRFIEEDLMEIGLFNGYAYDASQVQQNQNTSSSNHQITISTTSYTHTNKTSQHYWVLYFRGCNCNEINFSRYMNALIFVIGFILVLSLF